MVLRNTFFFVFFLFLFSIPVLIHCSDPPPPYSYIFILLRRPLPPLEEVLRFLNAPLFVKNGRGHLNVNLATFVCLFDHESRVQINNGNWQPCLKCCWMLSLFKFFCVDVFFLFIIFFLLVVSNNTNTGNKVCIIPIFYEGYIVYKLNFMKLNEELDLDSRI